MSLTQPPRWRRAASALAAAAIVAAGGLAVAPPAQAADAATTGTVSAATLDFGIKASFNRYVGAAGSITAGSGATKTDTNGFLWSGGSGSLKDGLGTLSFDGTVNYSAHGGVLDLTFSQPQLVIESATSAELRFNGSSASFADVSFDSLSLDDGKIALSNATTKLTADGAELFQGNYGAGQALDAASVTGTFTKASEFKPVTTASVSSASAADGLTVKVEASGYKDLPKSQTGNVAGVYAALIPRDADNAEVDNSLSSYITNAQIKDGTFSTTITAPTEKLDRSKDYDVLTWSAHGNPVAGAVIQRTPVSVSDAQWDTVFPKPAASSAHSLSVDASGLTATVQGANYDTSVYPAGVHVAIVDRALAYSPVPAQSQYLGVSSKNDVSSDFTASTSAVPASQLDAAKDYDVIVWPRRTNPSEANVAYRAAIELTAEQKSTLFGSTTEPTEPGNSAITGKVNVTGTGFTDLPKASTGKDAMGVYVAAFKKGTDLSQVTNVNMGEYTVGGAAWVMPAQITNGAFATSVTIPDTNKDELVLVAWVAHGNPVDGTVLDTQDITSDTVKVSHTPATQPTEPTEPSEGVNGKVTVTGTGFTKLPKTSTGKDAMGVYAALIKKGTKHADITEDSALAQAWVMPTMIKDGAFTTSLEIPAGNKDELEVIVWVAHGDATDATVLDRQAVTSNKVAVSYKATTTPEPTDPTTPEPTDPTDPVKPTTPTTPGQAVTGKVTVTGTGFTKLPKTSTGKDANGVYVSAFKKGTNLTKVTMEDMADFTVGEAQWIMPGLIKDGAFTTSVTIPDTNKDELVLAVWVAHGNITDATLLDTEAITSNTVKVSYSASTTGGSDNNGTDVTDNTGSDDNGADNDGTQKVSNATLVWGIKESFRSYLVGPIAQGEFTAADGATQSKDNGVFSFTGGTGSLKDGKGTISFKGSVHATGHHGQMDMTLSKLRVKFTGQGKAQLILDATSAAAPAMGIKASKDKDIVFATLTFDSKHFTIAGLPVGGTAVGAQALSLSNADVTLTAAGAKAMGGFYEAGSAMDKLSINAKVTGGSSAAGGSDDNATDDQSGTAGDGGASTAGTTPGGSAGTTPGTTSGTGSQQQCRTVQVPGTSGGVSLSWGVKSSFVSYVKGGIAKGKVTTGGGAAASGSGFAWGAGSGTLSDAGTGTVSFPGSVRFTGHDGLMDTTLSGLRVKITGSGKAVLIANVKSQDMEGKDLSASGVTFANVSFTNGSANGFSGASVTLTAAGAKSFAGFYNAGQAMDPMSLNVGKATAASSKVVCGDLASTGVNDTTNLVGTAGLLALLGAASVIFAARRKANAANR